MSQPVVQGPIIKRGQLVRRQPVAVAKQTRRSLPRPVRPWAPAGVVYATDAAASAWVAVAGTFPEGVHDPVTYPFAVTWDGDTPEARALLVFLAGPEARARPCQVGDLGRTVAAWVA